MPFRDFLSRIYYKESIAMLSFLSVSFCFLSKGVIESDLKKFFRAREILETGFVRRR
jgi:hypothetical protein